MTCYYSSRQGYDLAASNFAFIRLISAFRNSNCNVVFEHMCAINASVENIGI
jgi:hypothetical protein